MEYYTALHNILQLQIKVQRGGSHQKEGGNWDQRVQETGGVTPPPSSPTSVAQVTVLVHLVVRVVLK